MEPIKQHKGIVAPLDRVNVDTDAIVPKQFLRKIERTGFGKHLFHEWRFKDYDGKHENPDFILNQPKYRQASVLLARDNFGCGSSREHAPWALYDYGFRVIIAPSFADIFFNNCVKNGILLIKLATEDIDALFNQAYENPGIEFSADLESQKLVDGEGNIYDFDVDPFSKNCLLKGLDQIGWTLQYKEKIHEYEEKLRQSKPWLMRNGQK